MNARLDRIEAALQAKPSNVVPFRDGATPIGLTPKGSSPSGGAGSTSSKREPLADFGLRARCGRRARPRAPSRSPARGRCRCPSEMNGRKSRSRRRPDTRPGVLDRHVDGPVLLRELERDTRRRRASP